MQPVSQKDWKRLKAIVKEIEHHGHRKSMMDLIQLGESHTLLNDRFNAILNSRNLTVNRTDINTHMDAISDWIFYIMPQVVPLEYLLEVQEILSRYEEGDIISDSDPIEPRI